MRLRHLLSERDVRGRTDEQVLSVYRDLGVVPKASRTDNFNKTPEDLRSYKLVLPGDVVVNKMKAWQGSIAVSGHRGIVSGDYLVCEVHGAIDRQYLHHALRSSKMVSEYAVRSKGIRPSQWRLYWEDLGDITVRVPDLNEQRAIADFLDTESARIDALITKKRRTIDLLEERSRALVRELTRRGTQPSVELRDSGLPWVGMIPAHWKVVPNRQLFAIRRELVGGGHEDTTLLSLTRRGVIIRDLSDNFGKFPASFESYQRVSPDEIVFCLFDVPETPRTVGLARLEGMVTGAYTVVRVPESSQRYLTYLYMGFDDEKSLSLMYTGLRNVIRTDTFLGMRCPLPPVDEQLRIADRLDHALASAGRAGENLNRQLTLLREHRQALITAAVTGELAIPGVAA